MGQSVPVPPTYDSYSSEGDTRYAAEDKAPVSGASEELHRSPCGRGYGPFGR